VPEVWKDGAEVHELLWDTDEEGRLISAKRRGPPDHQAGLAMSGRILSARDVDNHAREAERISIP
jgi:hypothetical protein